MKAVLKFDGGSRGNPGPSACAYEIDFDGEKICKGILLGEATNNYAEWMGLLNGLEELAKKTNPKKTDLEIFSDSELVVRQVQARYKVKSPNLIPLHKKTMEILNRFNSYKINHYKREHNEVCDLKVNEVLDS
jgi:ribonuclease HI